MADVEGFSIANWAVFLGSKVGSANPIKTMRISMQVMAPSKINEHHNSFSHNP